MAGTSTIGGLITGLDTATLIDQLISISRRRIDLVVINQTAYTEKKSTFQSINTRLSGFKSKADILRNIDAFNVFKNTITTDSTNFEASDLFSVSSTTDANPGTHTIKYTASSQLAQARQLSSQSYSSITTSLNISGEFAINHRAISVTTTDSLNDIATKINNANSGINATGVTASILTITSTDNRLVLTSDNTGEDKFSILDASSSTTGDTNILQALGFTTRDIDGNSTTIKNTTSDGAESDGFSSSTAAVGSLLGLTNAQNSTTGAGNLQVALTNITVDLDTDSLTDIASAINAVAGVTASVKSRITDGVETFYIDISGTTGFTDKNNIFETLGILEGTNSSVNELHAGSVTNTTDGTIEITGTDRFSQIFGASVGTTDTITIQGTKNDGTAITTTTYNIYSGGTYNDIDNLLTAIETEYGGASIVDAYVSDGSDGNTAGQIAIRDLTAGDSQISLTLITNNQGGGSLDFGAVTATTEGYSMQTTAGQDVSVEIDGVGITRNSNSIDDVINGVTIDLTRVESGTTMNLTISRDTDSIKSSVNNFITEYNGIIEFINQQFTFDEDTKSSGVLSGESALSTIKSTIQSTIVSRNLLLPADFDALSLIGITTDKNGKLSLDDTDFLSAINTDFLAVRRLFTSEGSTVNSEITYINHTKHTVQGEYAVVINTVATQATVTGTADLSGGIGATNTETITITDTLTSRVATISLDGDPGENGSSIDNIVNAINSELAAEYTQILVGNNAQLAGGSAISSSTTFGAIDTETLNQNDEIISISGTTRTGISINNAFTITDKDTTTIQDFLSFIENTYNNELTATINSSGEIVLTEDTVGNSLTTINITDLNGDPLPAGLGVDFGSVSDINPGGVTGRYAMEITASKNGSNQLVITHDNYGSNNGFTITEANDYSGIVDGSYTGVDVAGTINGEAATGTGQLLTGDAPPSGGSTSIEGLTIKVTSTNASLVGSVANTESGSAITSSTRFSDIDGAAVLNNDTITVSGTQHDGTAVSYGYTISPIGTVTVGDFLSDIETNFGLSAGSVTINASGQISINDSYAGASQLSITLVENNEGGGILEFGTIYPGPKDEVKLTMGVAEEMYRELDYFTDQIGGLVPVKMDGLQDTIDNLQDDIDAMEARLVMERIRLENQFVQLEISLAKLQTISSFLSQQLGSLAKLLS
jgi:flagellar hook-associated protein 2